MLRKSCILSSSLNEYMHLIIEKITYLKEGKKLVAIDDHLETLVVNQGEKPRIPQLIFCYRQFLQSHRPGASLCS